MSATTTVSTKRSPILGWAIWVFAVAFCLVALYELHRQLFWAETCVLLSAAIIMFSVTVPSRRRTWAFIIALVLVLSLWIGTIIAMLLTAVNFATRGGDQEVGPIVGAIPLISAMLGLLAVLLLVVAIVWLASVIAAEHILLFSPENGQSRWKVGWGLLRSTLGRDARYGIVENGEFKPTRPMSATAMAMAPGTIMISPGHAAIFEKQGMVSQISGPTGKTLVRIAPQERCKYIVRLGPRNISFTCDGALTKDGIPLVVRGTLVGAIEEEPHSEVGRRNCAPREWHWYSPFGDETDKPTRPTNAGVVNTPTGAGQHSEVLDAAKTDNAGKANEAPKAANLTTLSKPTRLLTPPKPLGTIKEAPMTLPKCRGRQSWMPPRPKKPQDRQSQEGWRDPQSQYRPHGDGRGGHVSQGKHF